MKKWTLIFVSLIVCCFTAHAQDSTAHAIIVQLGSGSDWTPVANLGYERMFYQKKTVQLGATLGAGWWIDLGGFLFGIAPELEGYHIMGALCTKFGRKRNRIGVDAGYAFIHFHEEYGSVEYHWPVLAVSYQYYGTRGFHFRTGLSLLQGVMVGFGKQL